MDTNQKNLDITAKDVAADIVYMSGGNDPEYSIVNEIVTDTFAEKGITDEDFIEEFAIEVYELIGSAVVSVSWPGDDSEYVFNESQEDGTE